MYSYLDHLYRNRPLFYCSFILSGCYDNTVNIWTTEGEKLLTIPGHSGPIKSVAWVSVGDGNSSFIRCVGGLIGMTVTLFNFISSELFPFSSPCHGFSPFPAHPSPLFRFTAVLMIRRSSFGRWISGRSRWSECTFVAVTPEALTPFVSVLTGLVL